MSLNTGTVYIKHKKAGKKKASKHPLFENSERLNQLVESAGIIIYEIRSLKPFMAPYKDTLTICPIRLTIKKRTLFSEDEYPMPIDRVTNAKFYRHLMWGCLEIETFGIPKPESMKYLNIKEARLARRYILALIECRRNNIDLVGLSLHQIREKLKEIGMVRFGTHQEGYHDL